MSYPMVVNWLEFKKVNNDKVIVRDMLVGEFCTLDSYTAWFACKLDGKRNPYEIDRSLSGEDVDELLSELDELNLLRKRRVLDAYFPDIYFTLWIPRFTAALRIMARIVNFLLIVLWLPMLIVSAFVFWDNVMHMRFEYIYLGAVIGTIISMIFHEFGHLFAGLVYGGRIFELGIFFKFILPGAYVLMDTSNIKSRMKKVQVHAAGVEMNLLLTGIFLFLSAYSTTLSGFCFGAAFVNALMSVVNLLLIDGFDGVTIIGELLGIENLVDKSKSIIKSKRKIKKLAKNSLTGKVCIFISYVISIIQISLPILVVYNILEVISWFF